MATTSFQGGGYPGRPYGSFAGKSSSSGDGPHNPGRITTLWGYGGPGHLYGSFSGKEASTTPVVVDIPTGQHGGIGRGVRGDGKKRKRERVYINIDGRIVWFRNHENAEAYLREAVERIEVEFTQAAEAAQRAPALPGREPRSFDELDWRAIPISVPKVEVRGNEELEAIARALQLRLFAILMSFDIARKRRDEEELLLLH